MMDLNLYIAFFVATAIVTLLPGPAVMLTVAPAISVGLGAGRGLARLA